jgi:hypothetical protein
LEPELDAPELLPVEEDWLSSPTALPDTVTGAFTSVTVLLPDAVASSPVEPPWVEEPELDAPEFEPLPVVADWLSSPTALSDTVTGAWTLTDVVLPDAVASSPAEPPWVEEPELDAPEFEPLPVEEASLPSPTALPDTVTGVWTLTDVVLPDAVASSPVEPPRAEEPEPDEPELLPEDEDWLSSPTEFPDTVSGTEMLMKLLRSSTPVLVVAGA